MKKITFDKPGTMLSPVPVVMVTCGAGVTSNIITVAWTGTVNSEPPMVSISVRKSRHSHSLLMETGEFVINLTTKELAFATDFCGVKSGRDLDKFEAMGLTREQATVVACPMIQESPVNLECVVKQVIALPSHDLFLAEVVAVHGSSELFDESGKMQLPKADLLCYSHGSYHLMSQGSLGRFGYSVMKPKTIKKAKKKREALKQKS